jgi:hypothetical protein
MQRPDVSPRRIAAWCLAFAGLFGAGTARGAGPVVAWGDDNYQQTAPPDAVNGEDGTASAIGAGGTHSCAIQEGTGRVICWGSGTQATPPPTVDGSAGTAVAVGTGSGHSCAIQSGTNAVICWGDDFDGQSTPPPAVSGTAGTALAVSAGGTHSCAIQAITGKVFCWRDDSYGQITVPDEVDGTIGTAIAVAAGGHGKLGTRRGDYVIAYALPSR